MERYRSYITYINMNGWGFIDGKKLNFDRIYFTKNSFRQNDFNKLNQNDTVDFLLTKNSKGLAAEDIVIVNRSSSKFNPEDKTKWLDEGEMLENIFIQKIAPQFSKHSLIIHPMKEKFKWYIDLYDTENQGIADLKCQRTPFFTVGKINSNLDPRFCVTFNKNDYEKYEKQYKEYMHDNKFTIYWWVNWEKLHYKNIEVSPLSGVWAVQFKTIAELIKNNKVFLHKYINRKGDRINAQDSYIFDLRTFKELIRWD
ncbi:cold shock domain-containing protein [Bacillus subtilis]|uniref:cold shock domain-containing protein n=1 Tax=Bacillus inaquosorum TaxID=483913 RepID=UPI0022829E05|nr:cold shock domain-containing protein [Bacillus inaquosorum]MCY9076962.1 cold shock domain-containing protein [Bacillus inaquosorum]MED3514059.1 cold shock domain-containing protein [Bacillus subtilis]MED3519467.1 cold shock domain-containing protein [Bacillus subtilis]